MKRDKSAPRPRLSKRDTLAKVFGRPFSWRWFSPFHPPAPLTPVIPPPPPEDEGVSSLEMMQHQQHRDDNRHHHEKNYNDVYLV